MSTDTNRTLVRLRERLTERRDYAYAQRESFGPLNLSSTWTGEQGYWTGAADAYNLALAALDAIEAAQPPEVPFAERWPQRCGYVWCDATHESREAMLAHLAEVHGVNWTQVRERRS